MPTPAHRLRLRRVLRCSAAALVLATAAFVAGATPAGASSAVEARFEARGPWATSTTTGTDAEGRGFTVFHPSNLGVHGITHPIIAWGNGTGSPPTNYTATLTHLASWGFVVVASDSQQTGYGTEVWAATQALIRLGSTPRSTFHGTLDTRRVGAAGHSQGATGAVNATILSNGVITSTVAVAFVDPLWFLQRDQMPDWSKVTRPIFFVSATGDLLATRSRQAAYYDGIAGPAARAALRRGGHNTIQETDNAQLGYITAWFRYTLQNDATARRAFVGASPEIDGNTSWTHTAQKRLPYRLPAGSG